MGTSPVEPSGSVKFDDQTFLISYFEDIVKDQDINSLRQPFLYCKKINNNTQMPMAQMISIFNGTCDVSSFLSLKTHQYSALIPKVRLFRLDYDQEGNKISDKEFIFGKDYKFTINDIFETPKRNNSGIKRINWRLAGSNPVTAEKQVEVEIELYFDSISSFSSGDFDEMKKAWTETTNGYDPQKFKEFDKDNTTTNYWSLLFHPKINKEEQTSEVREKYNTRFFRIRASLGWEEVESNIKNQLFPDIDINEEIRKLNYSFLLNLSEHKFNFNEDGSLTVIATYFAQFENATHNYDFNLLGSLKRDLENMKNSGIGGLYETALALESSPGTISAIELDNTSDIILQRSNIGTLTPEKIISDLQLGDLTDSEKTQLISEIYNLSISDLNEISKVINDPTTLECLQKGTDIQAEASIPFVSPVSYGVGGSSFSQDASSTLSENLSTLTEKANEIFQKVSLRKKQAYYKQLFSSLINLDKVVTLEVTKTHKELWENWTQNNGSRPPYQFKQKLTGQKSKDITSREDEIRIIENRSPSDPDSDTPSERLKKAGVEFDRDTKYISFITVGDILEASYIVAEDSIIGNQNKAASKELQRNTIICGNISNDARILEINDPSNSSSISKNILDIPIDLKLLKLFLIENIVKPQKDTYSLFSFIKDVITKLVVGVLNGSNYYNSQTDVYADTSLATTIFSLGDEKRNIDPMINLSGIFNEPDRLKSVIKSYYINNINTHTNYYNYLLIYDKKLADYFPTNKRELDKEFGIYHFTVGEDYGLLKAANFSRIDTPYLKEAKAVGRQTFYLGQFRDRYNVNLTMVGNNIYYPGMMLYIQPSVESVQTVDATNPEGNPSFSQITGIGGYYFVEKVDSTISEDGYETKLDCIWQYDGSEKPQETVEGQQKCGIIMKKDSTARLLQILITKSENSSRQKKEEEEKKKQENLEKLENSADSPSRRGTS
jgi:hypothetical protein